MRLTSLCAGLLLLLSACAKRDHKPVIHDPRLFSQTVKRLNDVVLNNNFSPVIASRNYAYASIAAYECIAGGNRNWRSLHGQIRHLPPMPKPPAGAPIDYPLASLLAFTRVGNAVTFPEGVLMEYYAGLKEKADSAGMPEEMLEATEAYAESVSLAVLEWSRGDRYAQTRTAERFTVRKEAGRWMPTPPAYSGAMEPHWSTIRPLVLDSAGQFEPAFRPDYAMTNDKSEYFREAIEVKHLGDSLTEEQKHIADFFDDNPFKLNVTGHVMFATKKFSPPGHWMNIVGIAAGKAGADFETTVAVYTETAVSLFDGFIACWRSKYHHNTVRPETVINEFMDPEWRPYIQSPPFPSFPSGHSVISAAAAEVMTEYFGDRFAYTDSSLTEFGIRSRSFKSFRDAAWEASLSRLYGGIHFRADIVQGADMGRRLGTFVAGRLQLRNTGSGAAIVRK